MERNGKVGTKKRTDFDINAKSFAIVEMLKKKTFQTLTTVESLQL